MADRADAASRPFHLLSLIFLSHVDFLFPRGLTSVTTARLVQPCCTNKHQSQFLLWTLLQPDSSARVMGASTLGYLPKLLFWEAAALQIITAQPSQRTSEPQQAWTFSTASLWHIFTLFNVFELSKNCMFRSI